MRAVVKALRPRQDAEALRARIEETEAEIGAAEARRAEIERALGEAAVDDHRRAAELERSLIEAEVSLRRLRAALATLRERLAEAERAEARARLEARVREAREAAEAVARRIRDEYPDLARRLAAISGQEAEAARLVRGAAAALAQAELVRLVDPGAIAFPPEPVEIYGTRVPHAARVVLHERLHLPNVLDPAGRPFWPG